jgi:hypothetical protein
MQPPADVHSRFFSAFMIPSCIRQTAFAYARHVGRKESRSFRLRESPTGWLFCATGLSFAVVHFSAEYAIYALLARIASLG